MEENIKFITEKLESWGESLLEFAPTLVLGIVMLVVGFWLIKNLGKMIAKALEKANISKDIQPFLLSLVGVGLKLILIFAVAEVIGVKTTSFVAILAAAGFAVGMALQGNLSNFASGVMILFFKPYKVGDLVEIQDKTGRVEEIQIFNTIITTLDNKTVILPNSMAVGDVVTNLSKKPFLRVDLNVAMPYEEDYPKVEQIILTAVKATDKVLHDPAPYVGIESFDSHSIVLAVRPHAKPDDYWDVYFSTYRNVKKALGEHNIRVAYSEGVELGKIGK